MLFLVSNSNRTPSAMVLINYFLGVAVFSFVITRLYFHSAMVSSDNFQVPMGGAADRSITQTIP